MERSDTLLVNVVCKGQLVRQVVVKDPSSKKCADVSKPH